MPIAERTLRDATLDDKYARDQGAVYMTGSQALVRLALVQSQRDRAAGLRTAGFITGYRGSPMHNFDKELYRATAFLERHHVHFQPAVNEDIAATAVWGSQQASLYPDARYEGVFAVWYAKGPGLDRSVDAIRHANLAGTARNGGVLAIVGDDHGMKSSDVPATCEPTFADLAMPTLYPADVAELVDFGLYGLALSRFSGAWVGIKTVSDTLDTVVSLEVDVERPRIVVPEIELPPDGLNIRLPDPWIHQEPRLRRHKMRAALAFARANALNRVLIPSPRRRFGIIASGKAALDAVQALADLGIDARAAASLGITVMKVGMVYPLDRDAVRAFADGLEEVLVVEEKRRLIELGVKDALYALPEGRRPRVVGRYDEQGRPLVSELGELSADEVARAIAGRIGYFHRSEAMDVRLAFLEGKAREAAGRPVLPVTRLPYFCSGCPHNTSTRVPEGSRAHGGVGCHYMATYMDRNNVTHTHMGGEGATWIGQAPFVDTPHVFQNLGDGTYHHSGLLAIRACVAANVNITYKILFNDAVAMTGGQPIDGPLTPQLISRQVWAEGARAVVVVTDDPGKYPSRAEFAPGTRIEPRSALDRVQRELRKVGGVSALIYDQTCAAEMRRRRKRGLVPDPPERVFVNELVCEGCGDCNARSNCLSVVPVATELGRKRRIDQSSCNKDYSCLEGFCPSFVSVVGGSLRRRAAGGEAAGLLASLPEPELRALEPGRPWSVLVAGIGGTGVVTIGALITMAAHLEGKACSAVDQYGMAQKGGAVTSHIRVAAEPGDIRAVRLGAGAADLVIGCDGLVAAGELALETIARGRTHVLVNTHEAITGHFTRNPDLEFPSTAIGERLRAAASPTRFELLDATRLATALMGDSIATNLFMLGYAYQKGLLPVGAAGIERAIELNGVAVEMNKQTFAWGRRAALDLAAVTALAEPKATPRHRRLSTSLEELIERRARDLAAYQDQRYAERYRCLVERVRSVESARTPGLTGLTEAVARYLYKLMAYKDEYEVARLYTDGAFAEELREAFSGDFRLRVHLAPPLLARRDPDTGLPRKRAYGPWVLRAMRVLARLKRLRGTPLDPFGYNPERRTERRLIEDYERTVERLLEGLARDNHGLAVEIASIPEHIRGFGHVKQRHLEAAKAREAELLEAWRELPARRRAAG